MYFHETLSIDEIDKLLEGKFRPSTIERTKNMYESLRNSGLDLIDIHNRIANGELFGYKYFTFERDPTTEMVHAPEEYTNYVRYGLWDLTADLLKAALFKPTENTVQQEGFIDRLFNVKNEISDAIPDLNSLIQEIDRKVRESSSSRNEIRIADNDELEIYRSSAAALNRRLKTLRSVSHYIIDPHIGSFVYERERRISQDSYVSEPIRIERFIPGINIIQLVGLSPSEQKILVLDTAKKIYDEMMNVENRHFDFAIIVIDELNKYAPKGESPWKHVVVDISERGRERQMVLIGIEQFASKVDEEVVGNPATHILGRQDPQEVKNSYYKRFGDMKDYSHLLDKGDIIISHAVYPTPIRAQFPIPPVKIISGR